MSTGYSAPSAPDAAASSRNWALAILYLASFMNLIDVTIVNVALPAIQAGLGATSTQLEWVSAIYVLAFAAGLLPFGRFGDILGRKRMFLAGLAGFTIGSALCGLAPSIETLILARAIQGIAGAAMTPQVLAIIHVIFPPAEKGRAFALFGVVASLGAVTGPIIGGAVISADLWGSGWRGIFLINLPIGVLALAAGLRILPRLPPNRQVTGDPVGIALFVAAVVLLVLPLIEGRALGWPWWSFALMAAAAPFAVAFRRWQFSRARAGRSELLPASLLENRQFLLGLLLVTLFFSGIPGLFLILAIFFQSGFGLTPLESGLATVPFPVGVMIASTLSARFGSRLPRLRIAAGALILALGMTWLHVTLRATGAEIDHWLFLPPLGLSGFGMGVAIGALFQTVLATVESRDAGSGSGALQAAQQLGAAIGIAIAGQIFFSTLGHAEFTTGAATRPDFVQAAATATLYQIAVFAGIVALARFLRAPTRAVDVPPIE